MSDLPSAPGVYWFLGKNGEVLYVGKAKNLKNRVTSYKHVKRLVSRIQQMVLSAQTLKWEVLESELEALLVEAELIRTHQPSANILLKDDKTPLYIQITNETYPRVLTVRKQEIDKGLVKGTILGPFPSAYKVREVLTIARRIFPWCNQPLETKNLKLKIKKPCFYYHIDLCPGACVGDISPEEYQENIAHLIAFLRGRKKDVLREIEAEMKAAAANEKYELAAKLRDKVLVIRDVTQKTYLLKPSTMLPQLRNTQVEEGLAHLRRFLSTYLYLPKDMPLSRIEGYDVSNTQGTLASVSMVTFIKGHPENSEYKLFNIRTLDTPNDYQMMKEALVRRQNHPEWGKPDLVVIDGGRGQLRAALSVWRWVNPVISIAKNPDRIIIPALSLPQLTDSDRSQLAQQPEKLRYHIITLEENHPTLNLIQRIRDESHRFSKKQHSRRRLKGLLT
ncbi:MAG TPA: UvrB/UvrC motif-containing protein [Patescibacteria group bacterium]